MTTDSRNGRIADLEAQLTAIQIQLRKLANQVAGSGGRRGRWKAKLDEPLTSDGTAVASLYRHPGGAAEGPEDTGINVTVRPWGLPEGDTIDEDAEIIVARHQDGKWWAEFAKNEGLELFPFVLTEDMSETDPNEASANLLEWDFSTVDGDPITIIDPAENYDFAKLGAKGLATKITRTINEGSESEETITEYHIVELIPPLAEAKVAQINVDMEPWDNEEFEHGCEVQSAVIIQPCEEEPPEDPEVVDVVFIRREGREPDLKEGDRIQCVPLDLTADPPRYLAVGEYLKAEGGAEHYGVTLLEDVGETTAGEVSATIYEMDFSTQVESTATVLDNGGIFEGGEEGANGIAVKIGDDYHLIQLGCAEEE